MDTLVCTPPAIVPDFTDHFKAEAHRRHFRPAEPPPEACSPKLGGRAAADCASFTTWTQYTAAFAGCLGTAANLAYESMEDRKAAMEIVTGLHAIYAAVQGVNLQFLQAIHDINENEAYHPIPKPDTIPDFPTPTKGHEIGKIVESAWALVRLMLETALRKLPPGSLWVEVLNGLIASSDNVIAQIKNLFGSKAD